MNPIFWPLLVAGLVYIFALCTSAHEHGKERKPGNFWTSAISVTLNCGWIFWLLLAGGLL